MDNKSQSKDTLHVGSPNIGELDEFWRRAREMFEDRWLTNRGRLVQEFESELARFLGVKHCISMCNGTVALEIAIRALGLKKKVLVPSFTFVATAHALEWQGIEPVFVDIEPGTYCIDPEDVKHKITPEVTGILGVHLFGRPCQIEQLEEIADANGIRLLFDAAHSFGCTYKGTPIGSFGDCEVFSFHATKFFNSFEGGAVATNNDELAEKIRLMQNFGFLKMDTVIHLGVNGKMTEICAAMGLTNLEQIQVFLSTNRKHYQKYYERLENVPGISLMKYDDVERCNWQYVIINVDDSFPLTRDQLMDKLHENNVRARRYFWPGCHLMEPYKSVRPELERDLPVTKIAASRVLALPTGTSVTSQDVEFICDLISDS